MSNKSKKIVVGKSFRLFDFHIFDDSLDSLNRSGSGSGSESTTSMSDYMSEQEYDSDSYQAQYNKIKTPRKNEQKSFIIQMFGINEQGETASIFINDYKPFFYVHVGDQWTDSTMHGFMREMIGRIGKYNEDGIETFELVEHHKLYGFTAGKLEKFIKIVFKNQSTMNRFKNIWYENGENGYRRLVKIIYERTETAIYESGIPPLLRYFHIQNISPSGWVFVPTTKVGTPQIKSTTCTFEYICSQKLLKPLVNKETSVPYKICSFDIEASSSHGDFPVPVKSYKRLATNMVDVFLKQADSKQATSKMGYERGSLLIRKIIMSAFGYEKFDDVDLVYPKNTNLEKSYIMNRINILLSTPIEKAKKMADEKNDKSSILSIVNMFQAIDSNDSGAHEITNDESDDEPDETPTYNYHSKSVKKVAFADKRQNTIVDILFSNDYDRDQKIVCADEILTYLFPVLKGDEVTFVGSTFLKYGEKEPYLNHCIVVGSCDPVNGAVIESVNTEKDLLLRWTQIIEEENPDIIIGYNIFGFDYEFMFRRALENHCELDFLQLSRKKGEICAKQKTIKNDDPEQMDKTSYEIEHTIVKLASGDYDLRYFKMTGRIQIDMYTYLRRDFNLSSYKLDDVAGSFISDDIIKIEHKHDDLGNPVTYLHSKNLSGLHIHDYIHIELSNFTSDYYKNGQKFHVLDIQRDLEIVEMVKGVEKKTKYNVIVIGGHEHIGESKSIKWGIAKDDVTPQDIFRLSRGSSADRAIVAKYCIQDCNLVHNLMNKIDVITGYSEMARICSVPISFLVFRGQGIKLTSYVAKKCRERNTLMPDLEKSGANDGYEGAIVLPPKCSMYMDNPVACVDYASLYPSSMISQNLSHDSKVWTKEYDLTGKLIKETGEKDRKTGQYIYDNLPGYQYIDLEFDTFKYIRKTPTSRAEKTKCGTMVCRWAQGKKGIMPSILEELLKARADTRKMAKNETDPFMANILDKRQLGYKVTANSLYGQCGAKTSTFYEKDVAASTTATGRMMITYARRIIEEVYGNLVYDTKCHGEVRTRAEYVYGDTDSVFFTFNLEDAITGEKIRGQKALEITIEIAQDAAQLCTQWLKPPMELSYEKTLMPFILLSKKRYVGMLYETDPNKGKLKYMGLSLKRRDSCDYLKDVYGGILNILMKKNDIRSAIEYLGQALDNLIEGKVSMDKLIITKALRGYYKNPNQIAHSVLAERIGKRDPGNKPKPGDRMKYVHIVNSDRSALQGEKIETPEYIISNSLPIDYTHYITNQLMKPLQQLFGLAVEQIWEYQGKIKNLKEFKRDMDALAKEYPDLEIFMKKKEKYCSQKIKVLLFDHYLAQIYNRQNGIRKINDFFVLKTK